MPKILLIQAPCYFQDDMLAHRLRNRGYEVVLAASDELGLSLAVSEQPDLITIDLSSMAIDGKKIMRSIAADPRVAPIPNLALTSTSSLTERVACDDYECKPIEFARLIPKIEALLANPDRATRALSTTAFAIHPTPKAVRASVPAIPDANILIIDDRQINREMLTASLKGAGYNPIYADGGAEGLSILQRHSIDLVLLDVVMPEMTGLECLRQIRLSHSQAELPVIMATSRDGSREIVEAFELGANDYLIKPLDLNVSLARIDNHLRMAKITTGMLKPSIVATAPLNSAQLCLTIPPEVASHSTLPLVDSIEPLGDAVLLNRYKIYRVLSQTPQYSQYAIEDLEAANSASYILKHLDFKSSDSIVKTVVKQLFLREIDTFRELPIDGPVAKILKVGHCDEQFFLIEECIEGQSLDQEIKRERSLVMRKILDTTISLLGILVALHRQSIVHQTLHPSSFVRRIDGRLVLNDVGIFARLKIELERLLDPQGKTFRANHTAYAAPEQYFGSIDPSNDIYAVGMILLELLTRKQPQDWLRHPSTNQILWETEISVGSGLGHIIDRLIAPDPKDRYSTAIDALADVYRLPMVAMLRAHGRSLT